MLKLTIKWKAACYVKKVKTSWTFFFFICQHLKHNLKFNLKFKKFKNHLIKTFTNNLTGYKLCIKLK